MNTLTRLRQKLKTLPRLKIYEAFFELTGLMLVFVSFHFQITYADKAHELTQFWRDFRDDAVYDTVVANRTGPAYMEKRSPYSLRHNYAGAQQFEKGSSTSVALIYGIGTGLIILGRLLAHIRETKALRTERERKLGLSDSERFGLRIGSGRLGS